jgi:hypothetical protein
LKDISSTNYFVPVYGHGIGSQSDHQSVFIGGGSRGKSEKNEQDDKDCYLAHDFPHSARAWLKERSVANNDLN